MIDSWGKHRELEDIEEKMRDVCLIFGYLGITFVMVVTAVIAYISWGNYFDL